MDDAGRVCGRQRAGNLRGRYRTGFDLRSKLVMARVAAAHRFVSVCTAVQRHLAREEMMASSGASHDRSASDQISARITELGDWRGETLSRMRRCRKGRGCVSLQWVYRPASRAAQVENFAPSSPLNWI